MRCSSNQHNPTTLPTAIFYSKSSGSPCFPQLFLLYAENCDVAAPSVIRTFLLTIITPTSIFRWMVQSETAALRTRKRITYKKTDANNIQDEPWHKQPHVLFYYTELMFTGKPMIMHILTQKRPDFRDYDQLPKQAQPCSGKSCTSLLFLYFPIPARRVCSQSRREGVPTYNKTPAQVYSFLNFICS